MKTLATLSCLALCALLSACSSARRDHVAHDSECRGVVQRWQAFAQDLDRATDGGNEFTTLRSAGELALHQWIMAEVQLISICWPEPHWKKGEVPGPSRYGPLKELALAIMRDDLPAARERARAVVQLLESLTAPKH